MGLNQQITTDKYNEIINDFQELVLRKNNPLVESSEVLSSGSSQSSQKIKKRKRNHIEFNNDYHLAMLHHWTIYDSMFYSRHVAAKLGLWKEKGAEGINYLLAKMTIPTDEARQPWSIV